MNLNKTLQKIIKKRWSSQEIERLVGEYNSTFIGFALNERIRLGGSSGGIVTAILADALKKGNIDGALVCKTEILSDNKVRPRFFIAGSIEDLLSSQGSIYIETDFAAKCLKLIDDFDGKLAVVGLPCDINYLHKQLQKNKVHADKIWLTIGLFCGHNSRSELIDRIIDKISPGEKSHLTNFRFRAGLWRGYSLAKFNNDTIIEKPSNYFNLYQNLYFFCQKKCLYCSDHFAYYADLSIGDIWSYNLKGCSIKYSSIICRNQKAADIIKKAVDDKLIKIKDVNIEDILDGQARTAPTHNNTSAKKKAGKLFGMDIPDLYGRRVKWNQYLTAFLIIFNYRWSQNKKYSSLIFYIPRKMLKLYLLIIKALESL